MKCHLCDYSKTHKHGKTSKGTQRYQCPQCNQTFTETFDTLYYRRQLSRDEVYTILQSHTEGSSLRGVSRISFLAYGTVVSLVRAASQKGQMLHNQGVKPIQVEEVSGDEMWSFIEKNRKTANRKS